MEQSEGYKDGTTKEEPVWSEARFKVLECKVLEKEQLIVTQSDPYYFYEDGKAIMVLQFTSMTQHRTKKQPGIFPKN